MPKRKICSAEEIYESTMKAFDVDDLRVLIARIDGKWFAVSDACSHAGASLAVGELDTERRSVSCLLHGAVFDLATGEALEHPPPEARPIATYPVFVEGDDVYIELD